MSFTDKSVKAAEEDYISRWKSNAKQHFDDGDYEWVCELINEIQELKSCHRILEIGCGAGYSTLVFAMKKFSVIAIDINASAIDCTRDLIEENDYDTKIVTTSEEMFDEVDVCLWKVDLIHEFSKMKEAINENKDFLVDLIVLCNPGGQLTENITNQEYKYLLWGGFTEDEIWGEYNKGNVGLLHKWAVIYAACGLAQLTEKPILIIERGIREEVQNNLNQIQIDIENRKVYEAYRMIQNAPREGIRLSGCSNAGEDLFWGAGLYFPE